MGNYLPLLIILACPVMMIFMMRGMHGGHTPPVDPRADQRILDLERQVEGLRTERDRTASTDNAVSRP